MLDCIGNASLYSFLTSFPCDPALARPNTIPQFTVYNDLGPQLSPSSSPFAILAWKMLLQKYPGDLAITLSKVLRYGALIGYRGPKTLIHSRNLVSVEQGADTMVHKLRIDLSLGRVSPSTGNAPFISSPLGFVPKGDGGLRRIHHLSFPRKASVNHYIDEASSTLVYTSLYKVTNHVIAAGKHCIIMKRDIKDAFRNIPVAYQDRWLLGFCWKDVFYTENCLPFGLATAPFIFNLFAEGFHWMLESFLGWDASEHFLDDFIRVITQRGTLEVSKIVADYIVLTDILGIPRNDSKDMIGTKVTVLGIEIDTDEFVIRLPKEKLQQAIIRTATALSRATTTLFDIQSLTGFLSFCAQAVQLGWVFMRHLWNFVASFPGESAFQKRRIPARVRQDLLWWNELLPTFNGVKFFDNSTRPETQLFTDASGVGLGGYYSREGVTPSHKCTFATALRLPLPSSRVFDINPHEMDAILFAFQKWGQQWAKHVVVVNTDSQTAERGLWKQTLRSGPTNAPLRDILVIAARLDIVIKPHWIQGVSNRLADALSRFDNHTVANSFPQWRAPYSNLAQDHQQHGGKK
jgi:hypothetical protein